MVMSATVRNEGNRASVLIRVLGPVDLLIDGARAPVGGRHERMVLGALAISANHMVSLDQLAEIIWGDSPPPSMRNTLQTCVSRIRHRLGDGWIAGFDHAYELTVSVDELDALMFERDILDAQARCYDPEVRLELCRTALSRWRGPPFGDFGDEDPFRLEAIRLTELRLFAMELQLGSQIALGRVEPAIGALESLVPEHPYRERMWYLLVHALATSGRRVEALRSCQSLRELLSEVGLEPSADMAQLEEEILLESPGVSPRLHGSIHD